MQEKINTSTPWRKHLSAVRDPGAFIECNIDKFQHKPFDAYVWVIVRFPSLNYMFLVKYIIFNTNEPLSHVFRENQK
jgi:hypothetical protein